MYLVHSELIDSKWAKIILVLISTMPKKRRKLDSNMEKQIESAKKQVELITAKINDISDEEIQIEYRDAFRATLLEVNSLIELYKTTGYNSDSIRLYENYTNYLKSFLSEFEL
tara:strand:+ start:1407 stop:1745 length:339 start_codon:yes stop_codon:yes gene_type:complete